VFDRGLRFEGQKVVPEANAPSHRWLVIGKFGKDGRDGEPGGGSRNSEFGIGGATSAEKCRSRFRRHKKFSPGTRKPSLLPRVKLGCFPALGTLIRPKQAS
jgi:hypothetical protein